MTKKDYVAIARVLEEFVPAKFADSDLEGWHCETVADALCEVFEADNPRFNRDFFIRACGWDRGWDELRDGIPYLNGNPL